MPKLQLTDRWLKTVRVDERTEFWDTDIDGFMVRISPAGKRSKGLKTFTLKYWFEGKQRRLGLGEYPLISLAEARRAALAKLGDRARGVDPATPRDAVREADTVFELVEKFLAHLRREGRRTVHEYERILRRNLLPLIGTMKVRSVTRREVLQVVQRVLERGSPIAANRTLAVTSSCFAWAEDKGMIDDNPCRKVTKPSRERQNKRFLGEREIPLFWRALETEKPEIADAFRLLLLTGQRSGEIRLLRHSWIEGSLFKIPEEVSKNGQAHLVPISRQVQAILSNYTTEAGDLVLESSRLPGSPLDRATLGHVARRLTAKLGFKFTPHNLRTTVATHMGKLNVQRLYVQKILNHRDPTVTGRYDLYEYLAQKREALQMWADHVEALVVAGPIKEREIRSQSSGAAEEKRAGHELN